MNDSFDKIRDGVRSILTNAEYITAFLYGSRALELSHDLSDIDIMVLSNFDGLQINPSEELEVQVVSIADIKAATNDMSESKFLNYNSQVLLANLYHGIALLNSESFDNVKQNLPWDFIIDNMINDRIRGYKFYRKDAYKFYDTLDYNSSRFCVQKSLESLVDAYMVLRIILSLRKSGE